jgi:hypothetical protein
LQEAEGYNYVYYTWNSINKTIQPGVFATKYFPISDKFFITAGINLNYSSGTYNNSYLYYYSTPPQVVPFPTETTVGWGGNISPGLAFFPSSRWAFTFKLNNTVSFNSTTVKNEPVSWDYSNNPNSIVTFSRTTNTFTVAAGLTPTLGISYVFLKESGND